MTKGLTLREQAVVLGYDYEPAAPETLRQHFLELASGRLGGLLHLQDGQQYPPARHVQTVLRYVRQAVRRLGLARTRRELFDALDEAVRSWSRHVEEYDAAPAGAADVLDLRDLINDLLDCEGPAQALHLAMARLGIRRHHEAASLILGRDVRHFRELAPDERQRLWDALYELQGVGATAVIDAGGQRLASLSELRNL
jgi:hypothetical protein